MKKISYILLLIISLSACRNDNKVEGLMDKSTYKQVLKEIIMADMLRNQKRVKDSLNFNPLQLVYKKYKIDSLGLKKNADYYAKHPEILTDIYQEIKAEFQAQLDSVEKADSINRPIKQKPKKKFDSITIPTNILNLGK